MKHSHSLNTRMSEISVLADRLGQESFVVMARFLTERIARPESFVMMLGETSSGKSTMINGLLGKALLKTSARPTTGTIVEIMDGGSRGSGQQEELYYAVNRDATLEEISEPLFQELLLRPDDELLRLRVMLPQLPQGLSNLRIFDTPGYGSILERHEEVLKEFIPSSDVIIYVVSYRIGFKESDHYFLKYVYELTGSDTEIILVINRVADNVADTDSRVEEIRGYAEDCLHRKLHCHLIRSSYIEGQAVLPDAAELWNDVRRIVDTEERQQALHHTFSAYQKDLLLDLKGNAQQQLAALNTTEEEQQHLLDALTPLLEMESKAMERIRNVFGKMDSQIDKMFKHAGETIRESINNELTDVNKWTSKDECVGFIQNHLLPMYVKRETKIISNWIQDELDRLDQEINEMLNTAVIEFERNIVLKAAVYKPLIINIGNRIAHKAAGNGLNTFFRQFGGAGGAGAGVANAAKKGLKHTGKLFGKTFSRDTHNALASTLKKIGATSTKAIAAAAAVIVEGVFYIYDSLRWQPVLKKQVQRGLQTWCDETIPVVTQDLSQLMEHNLSSLNEFFSVYRESMQVQDIVTDTDPLLLQELLIEIDGCLQHLELEQEGNL